MKILKKISLKSEFPFFSHNPGIVYLDNAATTQKPEVVVDRINHFYTVENAPIHRGFYDLAEQATENYESVRAMVAEFIGADTQEIIFTANATVGINLVAQSWARHTLKKGDEILLTELEHHSNIVPWLQLAEEIGFVVRYIPITIDGNLDYALLDALITEKTKLIAITAISNVLGTEINVTLLAAYAQKVGSKLLIDACQSAGRRRIAVREQNIDFLVFSGHKTLAPAGVGILFVNKKLHGEMKPFVGGGGAVHSVDYDRLVWREVPACFEAGSPAAADVLGLGSAILYIQQNINFDELKKQEALLCTQLIEGLQKLKGGRDVCSIKILGPIDQLKKSGHIISFVINNMHAHDVAAYLNSKNIAVRAGHHCAQPLHKKLGIQASVRVSFHGAYNTSEDVVKIINALQNL